MEKLYYTPREVADILAISDDKVLDLVNSGALPGLRVSPRITRIPIAAFDRWRAGIASPRRRVVVKPARRRVVIGKDEHLPVAARRVAVG